LRLDEPKELYVKPKGKSIPANLPSFSTLPRS